MARWSTREPENSRRLWQFVLIVNISFLICSLVALGFALWLRFDPSISGTLGAWGGDEHVYPPTLLLLAVSAIMVITGIIACVAACKSVRHALLVYLAVFLLLIICGHLGAGIWAYQKSTEASDNIYLGMSVRVLSEYGKQGQEELTAQMDHIQQTYQCCGVEGPADWARSFWVKNERSNTMQGTVPESCCRENACRFIPEDRIHPEPGLLPTWSQNNQVYTPGCAPYLREVASGRLMWPLLLGTVIACIELLALIVTAVVVCVLLPRRRRRSPEEHLTDETTLEKNRMLAHTADTVPAPSAPDGMA